MSSADKFLESTRILFSQPFVDLRFDEENNIIITKWRGTLTKAQVKHCIDFKAEFIKQHKIIHNLNDHTDLNVLSGEVQQYLAEEAHPLLAKMGLRKIAVRLARDIFAQATVRRVNRLEEEHGGLQIAVFSSFEDAYNWLLSPEPGNS